MGVGCHLKGQHGNIGVTNSYSRGMALLCTRIWRFVRRPGHLLGSKTHGSVSSTNVKLTGAKNRNICAKYMRRDLWLRVQTSAFQPIDTKFWVLAIPWQKQGKEKFDQSTFLLEVALLLVDMDCCLGVLEDRVRFVVVVHHVTAKNKLRQERERWRSQGKERAQGGAAPWRSGGSPEVLRTAVLRTMLELAAPAFQNNEAATHIATQENDALGKVIFRVRPRHQQRNGRDQGPSGVRKNHAFLTPEDLLCPAAQPRRTNSQIHPRLAQQTEAYSQGRWLRGCATTIWELGR